MLSERIWMVSMEAKQDLKQLPDSFEFASIKDAEAEMEYLRFVDADIATVTANISLEERYGEVTGPGFWTWALGLLALALLGSTVLAAKPVNILSNGGFEDGLTGWTAQAGQELVSDASECHSGEACLTGEVTKPTQALTLVGKIRVKAGNRYTFETWA